jgi:hypothetical protein
MKFIKAHPYLFLGLFHLLLLFLAFPVFFSHPGNLLFSNQGDGIKNYYTLYSYVRDPLTSAGLLKYNFFAYPFGDYVYYTDNTPAFSIPFRWFCTHIYNCSAYTIPAYNTFILANILLTSFLTFFLFKRFVGKNIFTWLAALVLPWINAQAPRIFQGDFNLSYSSLLLVSISLFVYWYDHKESTAKSLLAAVAMIVWIMICFLMHGYYLPITLFLMGGMLFFYGIFYFRKNFGKKSLLTSITVPLLALAAVLLLLFFTDKYLPLRQANANGYDWTEQKTNFALLFTHYYFHSLAFPFSSAKSPDVENMVYLGNYGLFALLFVCIGCLFSTPFRKKTLAIQKNFFSDPLRKSVFWAGLLCLSISFGEQYNPLRLPIVLYTPVLWINKLGAINFLLVAAGLALIIYLIILWRSQAARENLRLIRTSWRQHPIKKASVWLLAAVIIYLFVGQYAATLYNVTNPFFYFHFFTKRVEQFRCLARFEWPFYWAFYIWIIYTIANIYNQSGKSLRAVIVIVVMLPALTEVGDYIIQMRTNANKENFFSDQQLNSFSKVKTGFAQYQSVIPLPYYIVGSEDYSHTINDDDKWSIANMQLALYSHLPLMSCKMSRTPPQFSIDLLNMLSTDTLSTALKTRLNEKPILIEFNRKLVADSSLSKSLPTPDCHVYYTRANEFPVRHHLQPVDSMGDILFYSWEPGH